MFSKPLIPVSRPTQATAPRGDCAAADTTVTISKSQRRSLGKTDAMRGPTRQYVPRANRRRRSRRVWFARAALLSLSAVGLVLHSRQSWDTPAPDELDVLVAVNTVPRNKHLIRSARETWGKTVSVLYGSCDKFDSFVTKLDIDCQEYPPIFSWKVLFEEALKTPARWYLKADDDTFIHSDQLLALIRRLDRSYSYNHKSFVYLGRLGFGREYERAELGLNGRPFVLGGSGVLLSREALLQLKEVFPTCFNSHVQSRHSDTLLGLCVYSIYPKYHRSHAAMYARYAKVFLPFYPRLSINTTRPYTGSTVDYLSHSNSVTLHSLKSPCDVALIHQQRELSLSLPTKHRSTYSFNHLYRWRQDCRETCSCTPVDWLEKRCDGTIDTRDHCRLIPRVDQKILIDQTFVVSLTAEGAAPVINFLMQWVIFSPNVVFFRGLRGHATARLQPGETGVKQTFARIFREALRRRLKTIAIFEDDVLFCCKYDERLLALLNQPECSCFLNTKSGCPPGILLLGATSWDDKNLEWMDMEKSQNPGLQCVGHHKKLFGAFAVIFNVDILPVLLQLFQSTDEPLDWYWSHLADIGYPVRSAFPFINIADVGHVSSVADRVGTKNLTKLKEIASTRRVKHGWDREEFVTPTSIKNVWYHNLANC